MPPHPLKRFFVSVTTHNRPKELLRLLEDIVACAAGLDVHVTVYDDASTKDYHLVAKLLMAQGWDFQRRQRRAGKAGYWRLVDQVFRDAVRSKAPYCIFLQDDLRLCSNFFTRAATTWSGAPEPLALNLLRDNGDEVRWVQGAPARYGVVDLTGWVDCAAFMYTKDLVEKLDGGLQAPTGDLTQCSGVGRQLSLRLTKVGGLYRVCSSFVVHLLGPSKMNPSERDAIPLTTVSFIDGDDQARYLERGSEHVEASLASIPSRVASLGRVVHRLLPQVDKLNVYLNGYTTIPNFLSAPKVTVVRSQDACDVGDAGKFHWAASVVGYHLTCDDDILYPTNYVERMIKGIERYGRRAAVGYHGHLLSSNLKARHALHFGVAQAQDTHVHLLGTGALGYHTSSVRVVPQDFSTPNMADIWFALLCQDQGVHRVCLSHLDGWLRSIDPNPNDSIYACSERRDGTAKDTAAAQDSAIRSGAPWALLPTPPAHGVAPRPSDEQLMPFRSRSMARPARRSSR